MCTQIERGKQNNSKLNKTQWSKWHDKNYNLNRSCVHQMFVCKVTVKHKFLQLHKFDYSTSRAY